MAARGEPQKRIGHSPGVPCHVPQSAKTSRLVYTQPAWYKSPKCYKHCGCGQKTYALLRIATESLRKHSKNGQSLDSSSAAVGPTITASAAA